MSKKYRTPSVDEVWRNRKTGVETTVLATGNDWGHGEYVTHKSSKTNHTGVLAFVRKYEFVREADR